jgi:DNA-binding NarL/FixJ family response regulator
MKQVLIVEDEALIAAEIESTLEMLGYKICGKSMNGDKALDLFKTCKPDIALLDINIKGSLNGIDLAKIIRKKYDFPFVFLTSYSDIDTLKQVQETMPYGYIVKPFTDKDLLSNIELALYKFEKEQSKGIPSLEQINNQLPTPIRPREYDIYILLYEGLTYKEIGERLFISVNTVKSYQKSLFQKLEVSSRNEAIRKFMEL